MIAAFLSQYAAGCYLAVAALTSPKCGWRYLRLMAIVSSAIVVLALVTQIRDSGEPAIALSQLAPITLAVGTLFGFIWLFINAAQRQNVGKSQRLFPAVAGIATLAAAVATAMQTNVHSSVNQSSSFYQSAAMGFSTLLGAALLGSATCAMLLGHRYLTDIDMPITPLRRMTIGYIIIVAVRVVWVAAASIPIWSSAFHPADYFYFWLALWVRFGVGLVTVAIFAWMVWDCVKRRATQSATALFYLSMLMVFIGELAGQYLMRSESLPM